MKCVEGMEAFAHLDDYQHADAQALRSDVRAAMELTHKFAVPVLELLTSAVGSIGDKLPELPQSGDRHGPVSGVLASAKQAFKNLVKLSMCAKATVHVNIHTIHMI